jgi:hypothetical protein
MEAVPSSEMFVATYEGTLCHNKIQNQILVQDLHRVHCLHNEFPDILKPHSTTLSVAEIEQRRW